MKEKVEKIKKFCIDHKKPLSIALAAVLGTAFVGISCWQFYKSQPKFRDLTVELGTESVSKSQFFTRFAYAPHTAFVSDVSGIDLNTVGQTQLTLRQGSAEETVTLTVQDTTAPTGTFLTHVTKNAGYIPAAADFITDLKDLSETTVYFLEEPEVREDYTDISFTVVAEDASGNAISQECTLSYSWLKESYVHELGTELTVNDLLCTPGQGNELLNQGYLDRFSGFPLGEYPILSTSGDKIMTCLVRIQDNAGPDLQLQEVVIDRWETAELADFIVSATDKSGDVQLRLMTELDFETLGPQTVTIEAEDVHGNITRADTTLFIRKDSTPPEIYGLSTINIEKGGTPDYMSGVYAEDATDGPCEVSYSVQDIDFSKAGIYYITYTARDLSGNVATEYRRLVIAHNEEDTAELVASIAAKLGNDPEELRNYVRNTIWYNHDWGGDDPVWYGFTTKGGNCYVHAKCLKALFDLKGITSQLIWTTGPEGYEQSHYWLQVYIGGGWKHIDPTPSDIHGRYSLMNDAQRYETLVSGGVQRDWDRSRWPACN